MIAAFCLTEAGAGSDAASVRTKAVRNDDGSWALSGEKIWITNGGIADLYTVFARTDGPEGRMTAFVVEAAWPGVSHGPHEDKMGSGPQVGRANILTHVHNRHLLCRPPP